ncbi:glycoside hydrolase family 68 protein [Spiroplasma floricola]|uniref:Levansucrase n=1 Tax=Spiroplasma floricola 23-6 TaxID=1336749 RepID=A0A2K8SEJ1_9MOLU|nr:glycoside hydrolase family 68 protein [Spiroplasma floricola]AUB31775.1 levansucrase [Spiroplasma floricola 23-6]
MKILLSLLGSSLFPSASICNVLVQEQVVINNQTYRWTEKAASTVKFDQSRLIPNIDYSNKTAFIDNYDIWDSWALLDNNGQVATINGYQIWFALSKPSDGTGHTKIMYFYSKTGSDWIPGGYALSQNLIEGTEEWSGSALFDEKTKQVNLFYTVSNHTYGKNWNQRIALAKMDLNFDQDIPKFNTPVFHKIIAQPDGDLYQTHQAAEAQGYAKQKWAFRDPFYFRDPKTNQEYMLFEGNTGLLTGKEGERLPEYTGGFEDYPENYDFERSNMANSAIGIAKLNLQEGKVEFLNPLWASNLVSDETERPSLIYNAKYDRYYMFTTTHGYYNMNLAPGLDKNDSLHGFTAKESIFGEMKPINDDGLILYSHPENETINGEVVWNKNYAYAWGVMYDNLDSDYLLTLAFSNFSSNGENELQRIRGAAPSLLLKIKDDKITIEDELLPAQVMRR